MDSGRLNSQMIRHWLANNKKTREWLAVELGVSGSLVNQMLAGRVPKTMTMIRLAKVMGVEPQELVNPSEAKAG